MFNINKQFIKTLVKVEFSMNQFVKIFVYLKGSTNSTYFHSKKSET